MKNMKLLKLILFSITISSGLFITIDEAKDIKKKNNDYKKIEEYIKPNKILTKDEYVGTIEIPKIKLKGGFYDLNNNKNTIDKNITLLQKDENTIVLAAHSGNTYIAYFNNINKLKEKDLIILDYKHSKTVYEVYSKYLDKKDGQIKIAKDNKQKLILVTCNNNDKKNYLVIESHKKEYSSE